jgi:hypothetical protein
MAMTTFRGYQGPGVQQPSEPSANVMLACATGTAATAVAIGTAIPAMAKQVAATAAARRAVMRAV